MTERELADAMARAAQAATDQCLARGLSRKDPITVASAKRAAEEVYAASGRTYEPSVPRVIDQPPRREVPAPPAELADAWQERADLS